MLVEEQGGKQHEEQLLGREEIVPQLLRAAQGQTMFNTLPSVIHELNNALNTLLGIIDIWRNDQRLSKKLKEDLEILSRAEARVREMVTILRAFAEGIPIQPQIALVNLLEICEEVCKLLAAAFRRSRAQLVRMCDVPELTLFSDPTRIRFVLLALLQNACEAIARTGQGGQVVLQLSKGDSGTVIITIEDEGDGITPEVQEHLFQPFITTKPAGKGAGLGLFLVHKLLSDLQGTMEITEGRKGTRVTLRLPSLFPQSWK